MSRVRREISRRNIDESRDCAGRRKDFQDGIDSTVDSCRLAGVGTVGRHQSGCNLIGSATIGNDGGERVNGCEEVSCGIDVLQCDVEQSILTEPCIAFFHLSLILPYLLPLLPNLSSAEGEPESLYEKVAPTPQPPDGKCIRACTL